MSAYLTCNPLATFGVDLWIPKVQVNFRTAVDVPIDWAIRVFIDELVSGRFQ
jgi:hypothetical protein